jgi:broad specificity phosphatase PhoE
VHECNGIFLRNEETGDMVGQPGKPRSFFEKRFPGLTLPDDLDERGWWNRPVETPDQWVARSRRFLAELRRRHVAQDDRVAVVTHGDFYRQVVSELFDMSAVSGIHFRLSNTAVSRIDIVGDRTDVHFLNRTDHLGADLTKEVF